MTHMNRIASETEGRWKNDRTYEVGHLPEQDFSGIPMKVSEPKGPGVIFWLVVAIILLVVVSFWAFSMWMLP
ncbi:MAG: hypothetical protein AAGG72_06895 [Pseudomonadota bacterium]